MSNIKQYPIFCLSKDIEINDFSEMIDWAYENNNKETVLVLDKNDVQYYKDKGLWKIISNETDNWLFGLHEDDWIFDFDIMQNIIDSIYKNNFVLDKNVCKIIFILDYAIKNKKSVILYL